MLKNDLPEAMNASAENPTANRRATGDFWGTAMAYLEVTKPLSVLLLVITALATMVVATQVSGPTSAFQFLAAVLAVTLACAGANAVSCYVDRDLDAAMIRTRKRPIPQGRINPPVYALYWGSALFLMSLALAWMVNPLAHVCLWGGMIGYVGIYSLWLKRKSAWNIVLGGFSGGLPALFGWTAVTGRIDLLPILIAALVVLWIPNHIWSLAIYYSDDYARVNVPMLPVVATQSKALNCILSTVILMVMMSVLVYFVGRFGPIYLYTALITGVGAVVLSAFVYFRPTRKNAWHLFKFSSPYLFLLLAGMIIDVWLA